jgi:ABC-type nitrate/sulfonate/bicarbonate transport system substrate-binding protein
MTSRANFLLGTASVAFAGVPLASDAQTPVTIRIAGTPDDAKTPLYYGISSGMYRKAGLDVQFVVTSSGAAATTSVFTNASEMGTGSLMSVATAFLKGLPIVVAANGTIVDAKVLNAGIVAAADSPVKTGADMNGKVVGVSALNDVSTLYVSVWVDTHGGDSKTLKFVELSNTLAPDALASHRVDMALMQQPQLQAAVDAGKIRVVANAIIGKDPYVLATYFANRDWALAHLDAVKTFARVTYAAATYTNAHPEATAAMVSDMTKIPLPVLQKMPRFRGATSSDPALLQPLINAAADYKLLPRGFSAKELFVATGT